MLILNFMLILVMLKRKTQIRSSLKGFLKMDDMFFPILQQSSDVNIVIVAYVNNVLSIWHSHFGHASFHTIKHILTNCNIPFSKLFYDVYVNVKLHQLPFHQSKIVYSHPLELVYVDIWGPSLISNTNGARYMQSFYMLIQDIIGFILCMLISYCLCFFQV